MRILVRHRDAGSQKLMARLIAAAPEFDWVESAADGPAEPLEGVEAVLAVGELTAGDMRRGSFGFVQTPGTGYENVDVEAATELGIAVANLPASQTGNAESVAEHVLLLMLMLARRAGEAQRAIRAGLWAQPMGLALFRKTACVVGLGDVGTAVATRLTALGMQVISTRRDVSRGGPAGVEVRPAAGLPQALSDADFTILCLRADKTNRNLMDAAMLARMKPGAFLVNIARGSLVDETALLQALKSGHLRGAGLDVFAGEPIDVNNPLLKLPNVIATPHVAGVTDLNLGNTLALLAANFRAYAAGESPKFVISNR